MDGLEYLSGGAGNTNGLSVLQYGSNPALNRLTFPSLNNARPMNNNKANIAAAVADKSEIDKYKQQIEALTASLAQQPRLPQFDSAAARATADSTANKKANAKYTDTLNRYLKKKNFQIKSRKGERNRNVRDINTELGRTLEDTGIRRGVTEEDAALQQGDINATENAWQRMEGRTFDRARAALLGDVADAGLTESGLGQGVVQDATTDRNLQTDEQLRGYDTQRRDTELFKTRTLADLDLTDERQRASTTTRTQDEDDLLEEFIQGKDIEEEDFRVTSEGDRLIEQQQIAKSIFDKMVADRLAELTQGGARSQDVELFQRIYG